jgi:hypothetical protein
MYSFIRASGRSIIEKSVYKNGGILRKQTPIPPIIYE